MKTPPRTKNFTFNINDDLSKYEIAGKVAVSVLVLAGLAILAVVSHCLFPVFGEKSLNEKLERIREGSEEQNENNGNDDIAMSRVEGSGEENEVYENLRKNPHHPLSGQIISSLREIVS